MQQKSQQYRVDSRDRDKALVEFLAGRLNLSRRKAKALLDQRRVFVNQRRVWMARHALRSGDLIEIQAPEISAAARPFSLLYQDEFVAVADKPAGLLSNGPGSLEEHLRLRLKMPGLVAVHRLDRDTTGCNLFAATAALRDKLIPLFQAQAVTKVYHAIAIGRIVQQVREITRPIDHQRAMTRVEVLDANELASHLRVALHTGRTHQIRKHLAAGRHPLVGDKIYATGQVAHAVLRSARRQMLHAQHLALVHPVTGQPVRVSAPLPPDFRACLRALKLT